MVSTVPKEESSLTISQDLWTEHKELLRRTICKGSSDEELVLFIHACNRTGLDPLMKQIYAVRRWSSFDKREVMSIQTSIDGFRVIAERTGRYAPGEETKYNYNSDGSILSATAYVKKLTIDGQWHSISATAFWDEYCQKTKEGSPSQFWSKMPHTMLAKCAESLALRKSFPAEMSGLYTVEEMGQAARVSGNEEAVTLDHAQALEMARKTENELLEALYKKLEGMNIDKIPQYLNYCFAKTPKRDFLEAALEDTARFMEFYNRWVDKNRDQPINL